MEEREEECRSHGLERGLFLASGINKPPTLSERKIMRVQLREGGQRWCWNLWTFSSHSFHFFSEGRSYVKVR